MSQKNLSDSREDRNISGENMEKLYIVMPAYNEEANIELVVKSWHPLLEGKSPDSRLIIADSGSTDLTHDILLGLKDVYPQLELLSDTEHQHGPKVIALYDHSIREGADYIFQTDSDGQTIPDEFIDFWNIRNTYDVILGKRLIRGDGKSRAFVERVLCVLLKIFFNVNVPDANAPFRLMKTSIVKKYLGKLPPNYNLPNVMLTTFFSYYGEKVVFKEITFKSRQGGVNSVNIPKIIKIGRKALGDFRKFKKCM